MQGPRHAAGGCQQPHYIQWRQPARLRRRFNSIRSHRSLLSVDPKSGFWRRGFSELRAGGIGDHQGRRIGDCVENRMSRLSNTIFDVSNSRRPDTDDKLKSLIWFQPYQCTHGRTPIGAPYSPLWLFRRTVFGQEPRCGLDPGNITSS